MMDWVLKDVDFAEPFVDDFIISNDEEDEEALLYKHAEHVRLVLEQFRKWTVVFDMAKAQMFVGKVEFCGHILGNG